MSDIKLFRLVNRRAQELQGDASGLEKPLQSLIEANLEPLLGIRFLATEHSTGKTHAGRIDSLGLDENNCPVILEYKRSVGENVINQGLFYLDWLMDHQAEFKLLVMDVLGAEASTRIDWSSPRLICIAADFTKYDAHAVQQINRNIELIRYRLFGDELLLLEQAGVAGQQSGGFVERKSEISTRKGPKNASGDKTFAEWLGVISDPLREVLASTEDYILSLGDDVLRKELKLYVAFKRLKNFATVVLQKNKMLLYLHLNPDHLQLLPPNGRDVRSCGHWGTGDLELSLSSMEDLERVKDLVRQAYEGRGQAAGSSEPARER